MPLSAEHVQINRVENGWVLTVFQAGTNLMLVAKSVEEVAGFVKGIEWTTPRPLYGDQMLGGAPSGYTTGGVNPGPVPR